ncbi:MAG: 3'-5' exonuclease [Thermoguttaceae bacterium]|nr:3'-5' exonuclease [Thermoguttaceae bacterium]
MPNAETISYFVFDIESVPDPALVSLVRTAGEQAPIDALKEYQTELMKKKGTDFVPYAFHVPISLALAKIRSDFSLKDLVVLKIEDGGPRNICERFWNGWKYYDHPQLVTFNGRGFDIPLLELTAFKYGIPLGKWFDDQKPSYQQCRNRYSGTHLDLYDFLTNFGATSIIGGLNLAAKILRKPGKIDTKGDMVQELMEEGRLNEIHSYCRCDVLDTYFIFLRASVLRGKISPEREVELIEQTRAFLEARVNETPVYGEYINAWERVENFLKSNDEISKLVAFSRLD